MYIQPFSMIVDWPEIWCLMEVSKLLCFIFAHTAFYFVGQNGPWFIVENNTWKNLDMHLYQIPVFAESIVERIYGTFSWYK